VSTVSVESTMATVSTVSVAAATATMRFGNSVAKFSSYEIRSLNCASFYVAR